MPGAFDVMGANPRASFTPKLHRGDGMLLIAMNWKNGKEKKRIEPANPPMKTGDRAWWEEDRRNVRKIRDGKWFVLGGG